jgi:hypothetical protein
LPASGNGGHDSSIDLRWHFEIAAIKLWPRNCQFIQNNFLQELNHLETFPSAFRDDSITWRNPRSQ